jgi:transaldolase
MKFFIDTGDIDEIIDLAATGLVDGVTTNPSLVMKCGKHIHDLIAEICAVVEGPVSAEVAATDHATMLREGRRLAQIATNVCVKVPRTVDGLKTCKSLSDESIPVNVTLCFSAGQALLAAKAGAKFISPFVGRLDEIGHDGLELISQIVEIYNNYEDLDTEVPVASVRGPGHVIEAARIGAHVATIPPAVLRQLYQHPLTDKGLAVFVADWQNTGQSILP